MSDKKVTRLKGRHDTGNDVRLEQVTKGTYERWDHSTNRWEFGLYEGSNTFTISAHFNRYYKKSNRLTEALEYLTIPLDDKETLTAIRDLLNKAIKFQEKN